MITTKLCTCNNSATVVLLTEICNYFHKWIHGKITFPSILNYDGKFVSNTYTGLILEITEIILTISYFILDLKCIIGVTTSVKTGLYIQWWDSIVDTDGLGLWHQVIDSHNTDLYIIMLPCTSSFVIGKRYCRILNIGMWHLCCYGIYIILWLQIEAYVNNTKCNSIRCFIQELLQHWWLNPQH